MLATGQDGQQVRSEVGHRTPFVVDCPASMDLAVGTRHPHPTRPVARTVPSSTTTETILHLMTAPGTDLPTSGHP